MGRTRIAASGHDGESALSTVSLDEYHDVHHRASDRPAVLLHGVSTLLASTRGARPPGRARGPDGPVSTDGSRPESWHGLRRRRRLEHFALRRRQRSVRSERVNNGAVNPLPPKAPSRHASENSSPAAAASRCCEREEPSSDGATPVGRPGLPQETTHFRGDAVCGRVRGSLSLRHHGSGECSEDFSANAQTLRRSIGRSAGAGSCRRRANVQRPRNFGGRRSKNA